jgi:hypothetical protein
MNQRSSNVLITSLILMLGLCVGFGVWQNTHGGVGGDISPAKVLWLWMAIGCFLVIPACLWGDARLSGAARRLWGVFFLGFAVRVAIEMPMLAFSRAWRCEYGIAHDAVMLLWLGRGLFGLPRADRVTRTFAVLVSLALVAEMLNAFLFSQAADPAQGVYFASKAQAFATINRITWIELAILLPLLVYGAWVHRKGAKT